MSLPAAAPPSRWRRGRRWLLTGLLVAVAFLFSAVALMSAVQRGQVAPLQQPLATMAGVGAGLGFVGVFVVPLLLVWRRRHPHRVMVVAALAAVLLPLSPVTSALALGGLVHRRESREVWWWVAAQAAVTTWFAGWDLRGQTPATSALRALGSPVDAPDTAYVPFPVASLTVLYAVLVGLPVAVGLYRRNQRRLRTSQEQLVAEHAEAGRLSHELGRQGERDMIAREVHDVIGHRLSLLSLHAGGLEVAAERADPDLARSAALVRQSAQETMDDLRSLVTVLRSGERPDDPGGVLPTSLAELPQVVEESLGAGMAVSSSVVLTDPRSADPVLAQAVYRIVQELLTNARKHARGAPVRLSVQGGPADGVHIEASNDADPARVGPVGAGLRGVEERVTLLGGTLESGTDGQGRYGVRVRLPWSAGG